jgi:hypothetical protein
MWKLIPVLLSFWVAALAGAKLPESPPDPAKAEAVRKANAETARRNAAALGKAQDRVVEHYKRHLQGKTADRPQTTALRGKGGAKMRGRLEKLSCKLGTEDRHARIAVELIGGRVKSIAYYSKWKPRTCSVYIVRDDAWSRWQDSGSVTTVTLNEDKGAFLIDYQRRGVKFLFRNIDRERFCGMEGKITGSLTVTRGRDRCELEGVMDEGSDMINPPKVS